MDRQLLLMHQAMLGDGARLSAYAKAIELAVRPGDVVADLGCGLLPLTFMALDAGARHVYSIEADPQTAAVARDLVTDNGLGDQVTVVEGDAARLATPEPVDVAVGELLGNLGPEEDGQRIMAAFAARNLRPGGKVIPGAVETLLAPAEFDGEGWGLWSQFNRWNLSAVQRHAPQAPHLHFPQREVRLLGKPQRLTEADGSFEPMRIGVDTPGMLHGLVGFFSADLGGGVTLSNFPVYPGCNWAPWVWPLKHTLVSPGDQIEATMIAGVPRRDASNWALRCGLRRTGAGR
jgi:enediyne biosynthesis protein CalE3